MKIGSLIGTAYNHYSHIPVIPDTFISDWWFEQMTMFIDPFLEVESFESIFTWHTLVFYQLKRLGCHEGQKFTNTGIKAL